MSIAHETKASPRTPLGVQCLVRELDVNRITNMALLEECETFSASVGYRHGTPPG